MAGVTVNLVELYKFNHGFLIPANPGPAGLLAEDFFDRCLKSVPIPAP